MPLLSSAAASLRASTLTQRLLALLALGLLLHLVFGSLLTLSVDEAHYALYADKLALSYFDHPPLVGWLQWPLVALGVPDGVLRLIPQLLWLAACLIARDLTLQLPRVAKHRGRRALGRGSGAARPITACFRCRSAA